MFDRLRRNRISDVYFHVGPWLESDGGISKRKYKYADELLLNARGMYPELRIHAWIGQMTVQGGGPLDLKEVDVSQRIVATSADFLRLGFDGIHFDFEPVYSGDGDFIELLKQTRKLTTKQNRYLSIASGQLELAPLSGRVIRLVAPRTSVWTEKYFLEVAKNVDQIAVMLYDTALPTDWLYGMYTAQQTKQLAPFLTPKATLLIGVPTYDDNRAGHRPWAENIGTAIRGVQLGLSQTDLKKIDNFGIAIFAEWTTDEKEWKTFRNEWLYNPISHSEKHQTN